MQRTEIARLLPEVLQRGAAEGRPLAAALAVMEALHAPAEAVLERLDDYFSALEAPEDFLPLLARWVDLDRLLAGPRGDQRPPIAPGRMRLLVLDAAALSQWRGTARGLVRFLEVATGAPGFVIEEAVPDAADRPRPFHMRVLAPAEAAPQGALVERIVRQEKPAYVTHEIVYRADAEARP